MTEIIEVDADALETMRRRSVSDTRWAAYQNQALDSANCGHLQFLAVGLAHTFASPPPQFPQDNINGMGWRYRFVGWVDLETGRVVRDG